VPKGDDRPPGADHDVLPEGVDEPPPQPPEEEECWPFSLTRPTERVTDVRVGTPVSGTPRRPDIIVIAPGIGVIGFAPEREARLMLSRMESEPATSTLAGQVDSVRGETAAVTLCLWR